MLNRRRAAVKLPHTNSKDRKPTRSSLVKPCHGRKVARLARFYLPGQVVHTSRSGDLTTVDRGVAEREGLK